tara:strand:- start:957 stop:1205 length:249 start_codon:yes stop_codon:yes gene_type:complete
LRARELKEKTTAHTDRFFTRMIVYRKYKTVNDERKELATPKICVCLLLGPSLNKAKEQQQQDSINIPAEFLVWCLFAVFSLR